MNEKLVMERDRELFYQDFLYEFYVGGGYNSFITSTINRFIPYLFSNDNILRTRYKNDTTEIVNYIFEIAIYFWMTPKVSDRTPITSVKRQIQQILNQSLQKGSFIFDLLSAAGQVNNDPENESQLLYWKLIAVILEMDTYNDLLNDALTSGRY